MKRKIIASLTLAIHLAGMLSISANTEYAEGTTIKVNSQDIVLYSHKNRMTNIVNCLSNVDSNNLKISQHTISIFDSSWINNKTESETKDILLNSLNSHNPSIIIDSKYISYTHLEHHYIDTCHHEEKLFGLINDNTEYHTQWIPYYVIVYNGHAEGQYATWS